MPSNPPKPHSDALDVNRRTFLSSLAVAGAMPTALSSIDSLPKAIPSSVLLDEPDPPGAEAGRRIGNGIRAAVQTAFPAISSLIEAIWPKKNAKPDDKQTKNAVQAEVEKYQKDILAKVNDSIKDVSKLVDQLDTLNKFSKACDNAALSVLRLQFFLATPITADDKNQWSSIDEEWEIAGKALDSLKDITVVGFDSYVTDTLTRIQESRSNLLVRVVARSKARDAAGMKTHLDKLGVLLEATRNLGTYQIGQVKVAFNELKKPITPAKIITDTPPPPPPPTDRNIEAGFRERVQKLITFSEVKNN